MTDDLIGQYGYVGIIVILVLSGLGLPVPEEVPVVAAALLTKRKGLEWLPIGFGSCVLGILLGDFIVYGLGYYYGERVLNLRLTRKVLNRARESQIKGYFRRHGLKIMIVGRFAPGFRTAAYLTAGILRTPPLKMLGMDLIAVAISTTLMFGLGWVFARQIEIGLKTMEHYLVVVVGAGVGGWVLYQYVKARRRGGQRVGPPVLVDDIGPSPVRVQRSPTSATGEADGASLEQALSAADNPVETLAALVAQAEGQPLEVYTAPASPPTQIDVPVRPETQAAASSSGIAPAP